jgi:putative spermidine/putrescine transport system ATP-binding protein
MIQTESFAVADRVAVMNQGHIEQFDPPQIVFYQPASRFVARFLGFINQLDATMIEPDLVSTAIGELRIDPPQAEMQAAVTLLIRPEAAQLLNDGNHGKQNEIQAKIKTLSFRGKYYQLWIEVAGQAMMFELPQVNMELGDTISLALDPSALTVLTA